MKVSVALCTFNGEDFLGKQLRSYLQQTRLPDEIVVCDDSSTDHTIKVIEDFKLISPVPVKIFKNEPRMGAIHNFEKAISLCTGDIIFLSDQDDVWKSKKIAEVLNFFAKNPSALLVFTDGDLINESDINLGSTLWEKWGFSAELRHKWRDNNVAFNYLVRNDNKITGATAAIHKDLKKHIFPFQIPKHYWHDCWLGLYAAHYNGLFFLESSLIDYRVHDKQLVGIGNGKIFKWNQRSLLQRIVSLWKQKQKWIL